MAFCQGNPLVFSGAVAYTSEVVRGTPSNGNSTTEDNDDPARSLLLGSLVAVAVNSKDAPRRGGGGRGKNNNNNRSKQRRKKKEKEKAVYPHSVLVASNYRHI